MPMLIGMLLWLCADGPLELPGGARIERWFVPADQAARFLPAGEIFHVRSLADFEKMVARRRQLASAAPRRPTRAAWSARFDPQTGRLAGSVELTGAGNEFLLMPWTPTVHAVKASPGTGQTAAVLAWGRLGDRGLVVACANGNCSRLTVDWSMELQPTALGWRGELSVPRSAVGELRLVAPTGWSVRSSLELASLEAAPPRAGDASRTAEGTTHRFQIGGAESFSLEFEQSSTAQRLSPIVQTRRTLMVDPTQVLQQVEAQFEALRDAIAEVSLVFESTAQPREIKSTAAIDWRFEPIASTPDAPIARVRWRGALRRPASAGLRLSFAAPLAAPRSGFRLPLFLVEGAHNRGDLVIVALNPAVGIAELRPGSFEPTALPPRDDGRFSLALAGFVDRRTKSDGLPFFRFEPVSASVESMVDQSLDLTVQPPKLTARVQWRCLDGRLFRPRVVVPRGWGVERVELRNRERAFATWIEPGDDGDRLVIEPERVVESGQTMFATIRLEQLVGALSPLKPGSFDFPIVRTSGPRSAAAAAVACFLNDRWSIEIQGATAPRETLLPYLDRLPPTLAPGMTFTAAESARPRLIVRALRPEYSVEARQRVELHPEYFQCELVAEIRPLRGAVEKARLTTPGSMPRNVEWEIAAAGGAGPTIDEVAASAIDGGAEATVALTGAVAQPFRLRARWRQPIAEDVALFAFPDAKSWSVQLAAMAPPGRAVDVRAAGFVQTAPTNEAVWATRYSRLGANAQLRLALSPAAALPPTASDRVAAGISVHSIVGRETVVHDCELRLEWPSSRRLRLTIPVADVIGFRVDDVPAPMVFAIGGCETASELAAGTRLIKLTFAEPIRRRFGIATVHGSLPVPQIVGSECLWTVESAEPAWLLRAKGGLAMNDAAVAAIAPGQQASGPWTFRCAAFDGPPRLNLEILAVADLHRIGPIAAALAIVVALVVARKSADRDRRRSALVAAAIWLIGGWCGGPWSAMAAWLVLPTAAVLLLTSQRRWTVALAALTVWSTPASAQAPRGNRVEAAAPGLRVIVPFDPRDARRAPDRVYVPESLLESLERPLQDAARPRLLLRTANYRGTVAGNAVRWLARYEAHWSATSTTPCELTFDRVALGDVRLNGKPVELQRAAAGVVRFAAPAVGDVAIEVEFETALDRRGVDSFTDFAAPIAAATQLTLDVRAPVDLLKDSTSLGLRVEGNRIVGAVDPARVVRVGYRTGAAAPPLANPVVQSLQLIDVTRTAIEWSGIFTVSPTTSAVARLSFALPADLVIRRIDGPNVRWWTTAPSGQSNQLTVELAAPMASVVRLKMTGWHFAQLQVGQPMEFPAVVPLDATLDSAWVGIRCAVDRSIEEIATPGTTSGNLADFDREWEKQSESTLERLVAFRRLQQPTATMQYRVVRPQNAMTISQSVDLAPEFDGSRATVALTATLVPQSGVELFRAELPLPVDFQLDRVDGDSVRRWYVVDRRLACLRDAATTAEWTIRLHGRLLPENRLAEPDRAAWRARSFDWSNAHSISTSWTVRPPRGVVLAIGNPDHIGSTRFENGQWSLGATGLAHAFSITATPDAAGRSARSVMTVERLERTIRARGRVEVGGASALSGSLEFESTVAADAIRWQNGVPVKRAGERRWRIDLPESGATTRFDWEWQSSNEAGAAVVLPKVTVVGAPMVATWIVAGAGIDAAAVVEARGLREATLPANFLNWTREAGEPELAWRATEAAWSLAVVSLPAAPKRPRLAGDVDVRLAPAGPTTMNVLCRWRIEAFAATWFDLSTPRSLRLDGVSIDGRRVAATATDNGAVRIQLPIQADGNRLLVAWFTATMAGSTRSSVAIPKATVIDCESGVGAEEAPEAVRRLNVALVGGRPWQLVAETSDVPSDVRDRLATLREPSPRNGSSEPATTYFSGLRTSSIDLRRAPIWPTLPGDVGFYLALASGLGLLASIRASTGRAPTWLAIGLGAGCFAGWILVGRTNPVELACAIGLLLLATRRTGIEGAVRTGKTATDSDDTVAGPAQALPA